MEFHTKTKGAGSSSPDLSMALLPGPTLDPTWRLVEEGFTLSREHEIESIFTVSNGYAGVRGSLPEGSALSAPATFLAGVFDANPESGFPHELVILPDWTMGRLLIDSVPLMLQEGRVLEHRRILDLKQGVFWREWRHRDPAGHTFSYRLLRFASLADRHLLLQSILLTTENYTGRVCLESHIKAPAPYPRDSTLEVVAPAVWIGPYWTLQALPDQNKQRLVRGITSQGTTIAVALAHEVITRAGTHLESELEPVADGFIERWRWEQGLGETVRLTRVAVVCTSREAKNPEKAAMQHVEHIFREGFTRMADAHVEAWRDRWETADITVAGDEQAQRTLRFAIYHLVGAGNPNDERASIGARGLTGKAYRGHVFWDTEIYLLPFYAFTHPPTARALLMYRYHTLPAAAKKARGLNYDGALYAWESTDTGEETTPLSALGPTGQMTNILTGVQEHHISADIAYAVWQYWRITDDDEFFLRAGAEIVLRTARFWASRSKLEADGRYHIRGIIGPDEYHETVDDNAYTNVMAQWNLQRGVETIDLLRTRWPEPWRSLSERLELTEEEPDHWRRAAEKMAIGFDPRTRLFEQFAGYFDLAEIDLSQYAGGTIPIDLALGRERTQASKVLKQADVVAFCVLFRDQFPRDILEANFRYYEPRTAHGSSLSPAFHALMAARLGDLPLAEQYFRQAADIDLSNTMGNAAGGVHIAALGGLWQAAVFGFAGLQIREDGLLFEPNLPRSWSALSFTVQWRSRTLAVMINRDPRRIQLTHCAGDRLTVGVVNGPTRVLQQGLKYIAEWERHAERWSVSPG